METMSLDEAAHYLGVTKRQVSSYTKTGYIRPIARGVYRAADVAALKEIREQDLTVVQLAVIAKRAQLTADRVERVLETLMHAVGADVPLLDLSKEAVEALHIRVENELLIQPHITVAYINEWARTFFGFGEEYLDALDMYVGGPAPWQPYLEVASKLLKDVPRARLEIEAELRTAFGLLAAARRGFRQVVFLHVRKTHGEQAAYRAFPGAQADVHSNILALTSAIAAGHQP